MYTERFLLAGCGIMGTAEIAVGEPSRLIPALGLFSHPFPFGIMELRRAWPSRGWLATQKADKEQTR